MSEIEPIQEIIIKTGDELPAVGDNRIIKGGFKVEVRGGYEMVFHPGDEIVWSLKITRISGGIEVKGVISGGIDLECYRCLDRFRYDCGVDIDEHVIWLGDNEIDHNPAEEDEYHVENGSFDLLQIIRDVIGLSLPIKRICGAECKGLCSVCGQNLNVGSCGCSNKRIDARLKPLEVLKERLRQENKKSDGKSR